MGQKVHPHGLRVGFYRKWNTTWFAEKAMYRSLFFAQHQLEHFLKAFFHLYSYTKNSATKKVSLVDLKWFRAGYSQLYFFVFFYKFRTKKRRWGSSKIKGSKKHFDFGLNKKQLYLRKVQPISSDVKNRLNFFK